jgi:hypothetical protein
LKASTFQLYIDAQSPPKRWTVETPSDLASANATPYIAGEMAVSPDCASTTKVEPPAPAAHIPDVLHIWLEGHEPHVPPQLSGPHCLPLHAGIHPPELDPPAPELLAPELEELECEPELDPEPEELEWEPELDPEPEELECDPELDPEPEELDCDPELDPDPEPEELENAPEPSAVASGLCVGESGAEAPPASSISRGLVSSPPPQLGSPAPPSAVSTKPTIKRRRIASSSRRREEEHATGRAQAQENAGESRAPPCSTIRHSTDCSSV